MTISSAQYKAMQRAVVVLAIPGHSASRQAILRAVGLLAALVLLVSLSVRLLRVGDARTPAPSDPLAARVRYERTLVADADYYLGLQPRTFTVWQWQIAVQPTRPDPQRAFDDAMRIEHIAFDQSSVLTDVWRVRLTYQGLAHVAYLYRQANMAYTADYSQVQTWLDDIDADLATILPMPGHGSGTSNQNLTPVGWN